MPKSQETQSLAWDPNNSRRRTPPDPYSQYVLPISAPLMQNYTPLPWLAPGTDPVCMTFTQQRDGSTPIKYMYTALSGTMVAVHMRWWYLFMYIHVQVNGCQLWVLVVLKGWRCMINVYLLNCIATNHSALYVRMCLSSSICKHIHVHVHVHVYVSV